LIRYNAFRPMLLARLATIVYSAGVLACYRFIHALVAFSFMGAGSISAVSPIILVNVTNFVNW